jgi:hypothetical protein
MENIPPETGGANHLILPYYNEIYESLSTIAEHHEIQGRNGGPY